MAVPDRPQVNRFRPPAWMVARAQEDAARAGFTPDELGKKLQEIKNSPERARKDAYEHAERMGIDPRVAATRMMVAARKTAERPAAIAQGMSRTALVEQEAGAEHEHVTQPMIAGAVMQPAETSAPNAPVNRRDLRIEKRDDRRERKGKARMRQAKVQTKTTASESASLASDMLNCTVEESSSADAASSTSSLFVDQTIEYPVRRTLPKWYTDIKDSSFQMMQLAKKRTPALTALESLKNCIGRCELETQAKRSQLYEELRDHVHKAEITVCVDRLVLKKARILHPENGLPRIFSNARFPSDIKADAYLLYTRWCKEDFSQDILRGVETVKGKDRNGDRLDAKYRKKYPATAKFYGQGALVLGQWWPTQLCTVRDGAHGAAQGGIFGDKEHGTYSIVLSGGGYRDKDDGDIIEYSGTEGKNFTPTDATLAMVKSAEIGNDIRVIRSSMLPKSNKHRPEVGLRYDGLYTIKSFKIVDELKQIHRFTLERCPRQGRIRSENNASGRPTQFEVAEFRRLKEKNW